MYPIVKIIVYYEGKFEAAGMIVVSSFCAGCGNILANDFFIVFKYIVETEFNNGFILIRYRLHQNRLSCYL